MPAPGVVPIMLLDTNSLLSQKVYLHKPNKRDPDHVKKAGRIKAFVFHPKRARLVGYIIKQPDIAWMFRRADLFVARESLVQFEDSLVIKDDSKAFGKGAERALVKFEGVSFDDCVLWLGLAVVSEKGTFLGVVDIVEFDSESGDVISVWVSQGATANALLGRRVLSAKELRGFKPATELSLSDFQDTASVGALVVSEEATNSKLEGGVAAKAGAASAVAIDKAKRVYKKVATKAEPATSKVAPAAKKAAQAAGEAAEKGAFAAGRQLARSEHMFADFVEEFKRASK